MQHEKTIKKSANLWRALIFLHVRVFLKFWNGKLWAIIFIYMGLFKFLIFTVISFLQLFIRQLLRENKTWFCSSDSETCQRTSFSVVLTVVFFLSFAINFCFSQGCLGISLRMDHISFLWNWQNIRKSTPKILTNIEKLHSSFKSNVF